MGADEAIIKSRIYRFLQILYNGGHMYTTVYKDINITKDSKYSLRLRIDNQFYVAEFDNVMEMLDFCKEKELKAIMIEQGFIGKRWSDD